MTADRIGNPKPELDGRREPPDSSDLPVRAVAAGSAMSAVTHEETFRPKVLPPTRSVERDRSRSPKGPQPVDPMVLLEELEPHLAWLSDDRRPDFFGRIMRGEYADVFADLGRERERAPKNLTILRAAQVMESAVLSQVVHELGPLHWEVELDESGPIPQLEHGPAVIRLLQPGRTVQQVLDRSPIARLAVAKVMQQLVRAGRLRLIPTEAPNAGRPHEPEAPAHPERRRPDRSIGATPAGLHTLDDAGASIPPELPAVARKVEPSSVVRPVKAPPVDEERRRPMPTGEILPVFHPENPIEARERAPEAAPAPKATPKRTRDAESSPARPAAPPPPDRENAKSSPPDPGNEEPQRNASILPPPLPRLTAFEMATGEGPHDFAEPERESPRRGASEGSDRIRSEFPRALRSPSAPPASTDELGFALVGVSRSSRPPRASERPGDTRPSEFPRGLEPRGPSVGTRTTAGQRGAWPIVVVLALFAIGIVVYWIDQRPTEEPPGQVAPKTVIFSVEVVPPEADVYVDDVPLGGSALRLPKDGSVHTLRIEAKGFISERREFTSDTDVRFVIALQASQKK